MEDTMNIHQLQRSSRSKALVLLVFLVSACAPKQISAPTSTEMPLSEPTAIQIPPQEATHGQSKGARIPIRATSKTSLNDPTEKLLLNVDASIDRENIYSQLIISPDYQHAAYFLQQGDSYVLIVDGKQWQPVDSAHNPIFSSDGSRVALAASINDEWHMMINDEPGPAYESMGYPVFSPDGTRLAYSVKKDGKWYMIVDGMMSLPYDNLGLESVDLGSIKPTSYGIPPVFSPDSKRVAYVAQNGLQQFVVIDGEAGKPYDDILVNWDIDAAFNLIVTQPPITFSPDSGHFAYVARQHGALHIVVDGKGQLFPYEGIHLNSLSFSPDGSKFGYIAGQKQKSFVVINGKKGNPFTDITAFVFSPDSQHVAYSAQRDTKWYVVVDGKESPSYDVVMGTSFDAGSPPVFSPDSQRVAYSVGIDGKAFVIVDGQEGQPYDDFGLPRFSPDGKHIAFPVRKGDGEFALIDGVLGNAYDSIGPVVPTASGYAIGTPIFSSDGKHVAYAAKQGDHWIAVVDGKETEPYDYVFAMAFSGSGFIHYLVQKDHDIYLVTQKLG
jgi:Tol biopolymer transport system component